METPETYRDLARRYRELAEVSGGGDRAQRLRIAAHLDELAAIAEDRGRKGQNDD